MRNDLEISVHRRREIAECMGISHMKCMPYGYEKTVLSNLYGGLWA
jgi:hypothetical protein